MRLFRQLGTWGTTVALTPLAWLLACAMARALAQKSYHTSILPLTRAYRVPGGPQVDSPALPEGKAVSDPRVLTELQKYLQVWALEPGASGVFTDAGRFPWCWNPFRPSAIILRLKQKQAFLLTQHHEVQRRDLGGGRAFYYLVPDPQAALGGRRFRLQVRGEDVLRAVEL